MPFLTTPDERLYNQVTHPWDGLAATLANTDALRHVTADLQYTNPLLRSRAKTGSRSQLAGRGGRRGATFNLQLPVIGSGTAGTAPDSGPILEAIFGAAPAIVPATSVTYAFSDTTPGLTLGSYRDPASAETWDRILFGGVANTFRFASSEELAEMTVEGIAKYIADRPNFDNLDAGGKGGLVSFPDEPVGPVYNGVDVEGFVGSVTLNGVGTFKLADFTVNCNLNRDVRPAFSSYYRDVPSQGQREIGMDIGIYEENEADLNALRHLAYTKGKFDGSVALGETAGNIWTWDFKGLQMPGENLDESQPEYIVRFNGLISSASTGAARDELTLVIT